MNGGPETYENSDSASNSSFSSASASTVGSVGGSYNFGSTSGSKLMDK